MIYVLAGNYGQFKTVAYLLGWKEGLDAKYVTSCLVLVGVRAEECDAFYLFGTAPDREDFEEIAEYALTRGFDPQYLKLPMNYSPYSNTKYR